MSSHLPGFPGLPIISGLAGSSGVFGHALAYGDRRLQEADNKNLLNVPDCLQSPSNTSHSAIQSSVLPQSSSSPHTSTLSKGSGTSNSLACSNAAISHLSAIGGAKILDLQHRHSSVPASFTDTSGHNLCGVSNKAVVAAAAAAAAAVAAAAGTCRSAEVNTDQVRVDASCCPVCFRHFDNRWKMERHARVHTGERPFACTKCSKTFTRKEHLTRHQLSHDGDPPNALSVDGTAAGSHAAVDALVLYRGAENSAEGTLALVRADGCRCPVCFRHFGDRWKLERHTRVHTGERPFTCGRCGNSFRRKEHLVRHERSHDASSSARHALVSCSGLTGSSLEAYNLTEAVSEAAGEGGALRVDACRCPVCFRHFGDRWKLERHTRIHTGERPFSCERCGKSFTTKEHLVRHEMSHAGAKPHSCSLCGKAFTRKDHVDRHFKKTHCRPKYTSL